jgi:hypothetical protein
MDELPWTVKGIELIDRDITGDAMAQAFCNDICTESSDAYGVSVSVHIEREIVCTDGAGVGMGALSLWGEKRLVKSVHNPNWSSEKKAHQLEALVRLTKLYNPDATTQVHTFADTTLYGNKGSILCLHKCLNVLNAAAEDAEVDIVLRMWDHHPESRHELSTQLAMMPSFTRILMVEFVHRNYLFPTSADVQYIAQRKGCINNNLQCILTLTAITDMYNLPDNVSPLD